MSTLSVILALVGAVLFAFGTVLQQKGTMEEPEGEALKAGFLLRLLRKPVWLLGVGIDALGYACQAAALGVGKLVVVQPLLVSSVVFALPIGARLTGQRIGRREIAGAVAVVVGLAAFTLVSNPEGGVDNASDRGWLIGAAVTLFSAVIGSVLAAIGVLAAIHLLTTSLFVLVPAVVIVSAMLPRINRRYLDIAETFPELARIPLVGQFLGVQGRSGTALTSTSPGSGPS